MNELNEIIKIADIHVKRINLALDKLRYCLPFDGSKVDTFSEQELLLTDLLVNRFGKLQDLIGQKIIDKLLILNEELIDNMTMLDKIHKLERLNIIENADLWKEIRQVRNQVAHEYPDHPELVAEYLNKIIQLAPKLINILSNIKARII